MGIVSQRCALKRLVEGPARGRSVLGHTSNKNKVRYTDLEFFGAPLSPSV